MQTELTGLYNKRKNEIKQRLEEFRRVPREEYFYELVYCLLTPQTSARSAGMAVAVLKQHRFQERDIDPVPLLHSKDYYIRFHHTKANRLRLLKESAPGILSVITDNSLSAFERREHLVAIVNGYGLKEATHFLRNIGKNDGLAILDRHILRNLEKYGAIDNFPKTLSTKKYYQLEEKFKDFSCRVRIPLDELDLLFWSMETGMILK